MPKMRIAASLIMLIQILLQAVNLPEKMATILTSFGRNRKTTTCEKDVQVQLLCKLHESIIFAVCC